MINSQKVKIIGLNIFNEKILELLKCVNSLKEKNEYSAYMLEIREKICTSYNIGESVLKSEIRDEFYTQGNIKYLFKYLIKDEIKNKPIAISDSAINKPTSNTQTDAFAPPFTSNQVIDDDFGNFNTHRLFLNKYAVMEEHSILVTRDFSSQLTHLTKDNIRCSLLLMNIMDGVIFFNGGINSGASQPRKHMQCIPYKSMYNKDFGIFLMINDSNKISEIPSEIEYLEYFKFCHINDFIQAHIEHCLIKFSDFLCKIIKENSNLESLEVLSDLISLLYKVALSYLNLLEDENNISTNYSFILTYEWMLIIPRKTDKINLQTGSLNINSVGFLMTVLIKNENIADEMKSRNIISEIFSKL